MQTLQLRPKEIERLHKSLSYDPETGIFHHKLSGKHRQAGDIAGRVVKNSHTNYWLVWAGKSYQAHRVAWLFVYGEWPAGQLDHINGIGTDNRIANLRLATQSQNNANRHKNVRSFSPLKGVSYQRRRSKPWIARITKDKRSIYLGRFATCEAAHATYLEAAETMFGEFAKKDFA
jgi:hypothetical protein